MKTIRNLFAALTAFAGFSTMQASAPASTYTLVPPCARFTTVTAIPGTKNCFSFSVTNADAGDQNSYYTWNFGDGQSGTGKALYHCYSISSTASQYSVSLSYVSPLCPSEPVAHVYTATLSPLTNTTCNFDPTVTVSAPSISITPFTGPMIPENTFEYSFGDGSPNTTTVTSSYITHTYAACGSYIVAIRMYDWNMPQTGCYTYTSVNIACTATVTGIQKNTAAAQAGIFPNPASDALTVTSVVPLQQVAIFDLTGREMEVSRFGKETITRAELDLRDLAPGAYLLVLRTQEGTMKHIKFIKE